MTIGYFRARARTTMRSAGGDPELATELARWAADAHADPDMGVRNRVVVARDGSILARAQRASVRDGAAYITAVTHDRDRDEIGREVGLTIGALRRSSGQRAIIVGYADVCMGHAW